MGSFGQCTLVMLTVSLPLHRSCKRYLTNPVLNGQACAEIDNPPAMYHYDSMKYLILFLLIYLFYYFIKKSFFPSRRQEKVWNSMWNKYSHPPADKELVQDPQCHTYIPKDTAVKAQIRGQEHYFCSRECLEEFKRMS